MTAHSASARSLENGARRAYAALEWLRSTWPLIQLGLDNPLQSHPDAAIHLCCHSVQRQPLKASRRRFPFVERAFADSDYAAERVADATCVATEIVRKPAGQIGLAVHTRRWVVERCFAWLNRNRRLAKDFEATVASATSFLYVASAMLLIRRMARCT